MFSLKDLLRHLHGGASKQKPAFKTEREAYDFCRNLYKSSGGVTPELRRAFEFYQQNLADDCRGFFGPEDQDIPSQLQRSAEKIPLRRA